MTCGVAWRKGVIEAERVAHESPRCTVTSAVNLHSSKLNAVIEDGGYESEVETQKQDKSAPTERFAARRFDASM